jgi:hypothetical protein
MKRAAAVLSIFLLMLVANRAEAQLPLHLSLSGGLTSPIQDTGDLFNQGFHVGAALKVILIPFQAEASYDRMSSRGLGDALSIYALGASFPFEITPAILPIGLSLIAGGGVYHHGTGANKSDLGVNAGANIRIKPLPTLQPFIEGRGVMIFRDQENITYFTIAGGIRF